MPYYRTIKKYEKKLQPYQKNLQTLLNKSFREEEKINEILWEDFIVFSNEGVFSLMLPVKKKKKTTTKGMKEERPK